MLLTNIVIHLLGICPSFEAATLLTVSQLGSLSRSTFFNAQKMALQSLETGQTATATQQHQYYLLISTYTVQQDLYQRK